MNSILLTAFKKHLTTHHIETRLQQNHMHCSSKGKSFSFFVADANFDFKKRQTENIIPLDYFVRQPKKVTALVLSKLQLNQRIFARKCQVQKIDKMSANKFLDEYHLMNATQSAYNLGLFYSNELVALASFSKGRKMNRLEIHQRSFELIRFCCKHGITVTGGLTRLVKNFCEEKKAGDVMTYIDKQLSDGRSFVYAGFKKHSETDPNYFLINKNNFERVPCTEQESFDTENYYLTHNSGNIKLVYTPIE